MQTVREMLKTLNAQATAPATDANARAKIRADMRALRALFSPDDVCFDAPDEVSHLLPACDSETGARDCERFALSLAIDAGE